MKTEKILILILGFVLFSSIISAADTCSVVPENSCTSTSYKILGMYDSTNTHGYAITSGSPNSATGNFLRTIGNAIASFTLGKTQTTTQNPASGNYVLCCNFNPGTSSCTSTDKLLGLSDSSNAHAEIPSLNNYATKACWTNLQCFGTNNPNSYLSNYPIKMVSLSSDTNAHLGGYNDYSWKIICKKSTTTSNSIFTSSVSSWPTPSMNLDSSQLGTSAAKVTITVNGINAAQGTQVYLEIYERKPYGSGGGSTSQNNNLGTGTGNFISMIGHAIFNFNFGSSNSNPVSINPVTYIYVPIRTGTSHIAGAVQSGGKATFDWTITQADINAGGVNSNGVYEFTYKVVKDTDYKNFYDNILTLNLATNGPPSSMIQRWLDNDKSTVITQKTLEWSSIPMSGGSNSDSGNGSVITGNVVSTSPNLVYMNTINMPGLVAGRLTIFEIYEDNSGQASTNDTIRAGNFAITTTGVAPGLATAPWYILRQDIQKSMPGDSANSDNSLDLSFYYKIKYFNGNAYVYAPVENYLKLHIKNYGNATNSTNSTTYYLNNSNGIWTNQQFSAQILNYTYDTDLTNTVGMRVDNIGSGSAGKTLYFEIYGINSLGNYFPVVTDHSLSAVIDSSGAAQETWAIDSNDLQTNSGTPGNYKFIYAVVIDSEKKTYDSNILNVNGSLSISTGGGSDCDGIYYCSDYMTRSNCEHNACGNVILNENALNPSLNCYNSSCYCYWQNSNCYFGYNGSESSNTGACSFTKGSVQNDCSNSGLLITPYTASWTWASGNCYSSLAICSNKISTGESCVNKDGCWRLRDATYDNCVDYQESVECTSGTGGGGGGGIPTNTKLNWLIIILIIGVVVLGILVYIVARKIMIAKMMKKLFKTKENFRNITSYILKARQQGMPDLEVRKALFNAGWNYDQIDFAFKHVHK